MKLPKYWNAWQEDYFITSEKEKTLTIVQDKEDTKDW